jgi:HIV Tat-specific factor 1
MDPIPAAAASVFPTNPEEFDSDDRISFSKLDNKFLLVQDDGTEFEFDDAIKRWIPILDESKHLMFSTC